MSNRCFIYFRNTPKGVRFLPSYELKPLGEPKKIILENDPNANAINDVLDEIVACIKEDGGFNPNQRPNYKKIADHCDAALGGDSVSRVVYLRATREYGERLLVEFKSQ